MGGLQFGVQIKSRKTWPVRENVISVILDYDAVRLWRSHPTPVLLVLYDMLENKGYFCWVHQLPVWNDRLREAPLTTIRSTTRTITERVPADHVMTATIWTRIETELTAYYERFAEMMYDQNITVAILPTLNTILESLRGLYIVHTSWDATVGAQQKGMLLLLEMTSHRDVIRSASKLRQAYHFNCKTVEELERFVAVYRNHLSTCIENLDELVAADEACLVRAKPSLPTLRPSCINMLFDFAIGLSAMVKQYPDA
jgi:hypothetical protein